MKLNYLKRPILEAYEKDLYTPNFCESLYGVNINPIEIYDLYAMNSLNARRPFEQKQYEYLIDKVANSFIKLIAASQTTGEFGKCIKLLQKPNMAAIDKSLGLIHTHGTILARLENEREIFTALHIIFSAPNPGDFIEYCSPFVQKSIRDRQLAKVPADEKKLRRLVKNLSVLYRKELEAEIGVDLPWLDFGSTLIDILQRLGFATEKRMIRTWESKQYLDIKIDNSTFRIIMSNVEEPDFILQRLGAKTHET